MGVVFRDKSGFSLAILQVPEQASISKRRRSAELQQVFAVKPVLFAEGKGIFDVVVDGEKVFSKYATGRFPDPGEVVRLIQQR